MKTDIWTSRWWEIAVAALAANSVVFGVIAVGNDHTGWAIATGFAPAALLVISLVLRGRWRVGATAILIVASLAAASWFLDGLSGGARCHHHRQRVQQRVHRPDTSTNPPRRIDSYDNRRSAPQVSIRPIPGAR